MRKAILSICLSKKVTDTKGMKRIVFLAGFLAAVSAAAFAQIPPDWDTRPPRNTAAHRFAVGISQPSASEQEAVRGAWQNAMQQIASGISMRFQGQTDISVRSEGFASGIEDAYTVYMETSSFSTNVPLSGVAEAARKIETSGGRFVARVLATISAEDYDRARRHVENEEAAYLAYRHFGQRGLFAAAEGQKPAGFPDYYSWLRNRCVIVSIDDPSPNAMLEQIDAFLRKLYRNAAVFAEVLNGRGARVVYDSGKYYDGILRALQRTGLFTIQRESGHLILRPVRANILGDLRNTVNGMKDSGRLVIVGLETIQTQSGEEANPGAIVLNQFRTIASRQFNMQAANYTIPGRYLSGFVDEDAILRHIQNNLAAFPARYLVILRSQTRLEREVTEFRIPLMVTAFASFTLHDIVTGESVQSGTAQTGAGAFSPADLSDRAVIEESRRALQSLSSPRIQPGLEAIMREVFERL